MQHEPTIRYPSATRCPVVAVLVIWMVRVEGVRRIVLVRQLAGFVLVTVMVRTMGAVGVPMTVVAVAMEHIR